MPSTAIPRVQSPHRQLRAPSCRPIVTLALGATVAWAGVADASSLTVPDGVPTIQAAVNALVDTVLVRAGSHAETPTVPARVVVLGIPGNPLFERPVLTGMFVSGLNAGPSLIVRGLQFTGQVRVSNTNAGSTIEFEDCHFLGGILDVSVDPPTSEMKLRRCLVVGDALLQPEGSCVVDSCAFQGQLSVRHSECELVVQDSEFHGGGVGTGISSTQELRSATVVRNIISGFASGVFVDAYDGIMVADNIVRDCGGSGIYVIGDVAEIARNLVERCSGVGLSVFGRGNIGVRANVVTNSGDSGMLFDAGFNGQIIGNVISRSGRHGMELYGSIEGVLGVKNNTSAFNAESGFFSWASAGSGRYDVAGNIGYGNGTFGIQWQSPAVTFVGCNDWFENALGAAQGLPPSNADFSVDPRFCNTANVDFRLSATSPLANMTGCGQVGAMEVGCGLLSVPAHPSHAFRLTTVKPNPSRGPVTIELELAREATIAVEVFDVQGRLVAAPTSGSRPAGMHAVEWSPSSSGGRAPAGIYLVRFRFPGGEEKRRVVLTP